MSDISNSILEDNIRSSVLERLQKIQSLILKIGAELCKMQDEDLSIHEKGSEIDLVTKADYFSEKQITEWINSSYPLDSILAEEGGRTIQKNGNEFLWLIDPLDGTINYAHGLPLYAISIGLMYGDKMAGGTVYLPALKELYLAVRGGGATKNGNPIRVSKTEELARALVVTGFPYNRRKILPALLSGVSSILMHARGIRRTGSAALDLCWVAEGRFDALYELNLNPWDTGAGALIAIEAGATVTDLKNKPFSPEEKSIVASNGKIHVELVEALQEMMKERLE